MSGEPVFDKKEQLQKIEAALLPGEQVWAVFDMKGGGTGFVGITTKRVLVYDKAFYSLAYQLGRRSNDLQSLVNEP